MQRDRSLQRYLKPYKGKTLAEKLYRYLDIKNIPKRNRKKILSYLHKSKSQFRQDLWVLSCLNFTTSGYFVEIGVGDVLNFNMSNTDILEKDFGWNGILVEPIPEFTNFIYENRNCILETRPVFSESGKDVDFMVMEHSLGGLSGIADYVSQKVVNNYEYKLSLQTVSLTHLLERHHAPNVIDYLSLDTEGSEYEILRTMDFTKYKFKTITVEHNKGARRKLISNLLTSNGYTLVKTDWPVCEDWYINESALYIT